MVIKGFAISSVSLFFIYYNCLILEYINTISHGSDV